MRRRGAHIAERGAHDACFSEIGVLQPRGFPSAIDDEHIVTEIDQFGYIGRIEKYRSPGFRIGPDELVDLGLRSDIHAARWVIQ